MKYKEAPRESPLIIKTQEQNTVTYGIPKLHFLYSPSLEFYHDLRDGIPVPQKTYLKVPSIV